MRRYTPSVSKPTSPSEPLNVQQTQPDVIGLLRALDYAQTHGNRHVVRIIIIIMQVADIGAV